MQKLPSFALGTDSALRKLAPDDCAYSTMRRLTLHCCRRERESGQVVVSVRARRLEDGRHELHVAVNISRGPREPP